MASNLILSNLMQEVQRNLICTQSALEHFIPIVYLEHCTNKYKDFS